MQPDILNKDDQEMFEKGTHWGGESIHKMLRKRGFEVSFKIHFSVWTPGRRQLYNPGA